MVWFAAVGIPGLGGSEAITVERSKWVRDEFCFGCGVSISRVDIERGKRGNDRFGCKAGFVYLKFL